MKSVKDLASRMNPDLTFVGFMTDVMNNNLELDDLRIVNAAQLARQDIPAYAEVVVPWQALIELIEPHYPKQGKKGGRP